MAAVALHLLSGCLAARASGTESFRASGTESLDPRRSHSSELSFQVIEIELTRPDRLVFPEDLAQLQLPAGINARLGVVLTGRAPIWLYGWLVHECHFTRWVACYDPRLGAVVVSSHSPDVQVGEIIPWVSRDPAAIPLWHEFCRDRGNLRCVAILHTSPGPPQVLKDSPELEIRWDPNSPPPAELLRAVRRLIH